MIVQDTKRNGLWLKHLRVDGKSLRTLSGNLWIQITQRCLPSARRAYLGCSMSDYFKDFQKFTDWHTSQIGYGVANYEIDKDILYKGNKVYSEEYCALVPQQLNCFLVDNKQRRGEWPIGVTFNKREQLFKAAVRISSKKVHLGYFNTAESAAAAYKTAKEAEAYRWYERLRDGEFKVDPRIVERMRTWRLL